MPSPISDAICHTQSISLTTHGYRVERRRRWQRHARADGFGRGGAATAWAAAAPSATSAPSAQLERGQAQGSVAARGRAAAVASRRGGDGGGGGSGTRGRTGSDGAEQRPPGRPLLRLPRARRSAQFEPIVARPQLTSKACGARLSVSEGGRHVARREDDKCASYGSLFIGQSSGDR